jgi:hypothetical protein
MAEFVREEKCNLARAGSITVPAVWDILPLLRPFAILVQQAAIVAQLGDGGEDLSKDEMNRLIVAQWRREKLGNPFLNQRRKCHS